LHYRFHNIQPSPKLTLRCTCCFYGELLAQPPSWRIIPCQLSVTTYSTYSPVSSIYGDCIHHAQPEDGPCRGQET
jgi:hypothetical protein